MFRPVYLSALGFLLVFVTTATRARAERLLFQRGEALYVASANGKNARRLFAVGKPGEVLWAPSPDGRRIAWAVPAPRGGPVLDLAARPVAVFVADLSGQHQKRLLTTDTLRDRQGRPVTRMFPGREPAVRGADDLALWTLRSLAWSADGKSLYLSCALLGNLGGYATFVVDAATGAAVVDREGRWRSIAPVADVDARGTLLVGVGWVLPPDSSGVHPTPPGAPRSGPLLLVDLAQGRRTRVLPARSGSRAASPRGGASAPALSPDGTKIVCVVSESGLWQIDRTAGTSYRRLITDKRAAAPRWSLDGQRVLFLSAATPRAGGSPSRLYETAPLSAGKRRLLLTNVHRFFVLPGG